MSVQEDVNGLAGNTEKQRIRTEIALQAVNGLTMGDRLHGCETSGEIMGVSLPANNFLSETLFQAVAESFGSGVKFMCAEVNPKVFTDSLKRKPSCCVISPFPFIEVATMGLKERRLGVTGILGNGSVKADFIWADFCGTAVKERTDDFVKAVIHNYPCMAYTTFNTRARRDISYMTGYNSKISQEELITSYILNSIRDALPKGKKDKVSIVYRVKYAGGDGGLCPMITIGFCVGIGDAGINTIIKDRTHGAEPNYWLGLADTSNAILKAKGDSPHLRISHIMSVIGPKKARAAKSHDYRHADPAIKEEIVRVAMHYVMAQKQKNIRVRDIKAPAINRFVFDRVSKTFPAVTFGQVSGTVSKCVTRCSSWAK